MSQMYAQKKFPRIDEWTNDGLTFISVNVSGIEVAIKKFSSYMAAGAGNLPFPNIEAYREILSPTVAIVFNNFVISPTFPDTWKLSCVVPVYKSGKQTDPINYRQILLIFPLQRYSKR